MDFLKGFANRASDAATDVKQTVGQAADSASEAIGDTAIGKELFALKERLARQAEEFKNEKLKMLKEFEEEKRRFILGYIQSKLEGIFDHGMNIASNKLKDSIKDPYMPMCIQNLVDDMVDGIWPDVKMELKDEILKGVGGGQLIHHGEAPGCCGLILAFFRYNLLPYDRGFWRQLRNPLWWLFTLLSLIPKYGIMCIVYVLQFLMIDKGDEFQLFQFIVQFKALQFLTIGILGSCLGSVQYYICVSRNDCAENSPRESFWTIILFCLQVVVVFIAFLMLNCSEKKGGFYYQLEQESQARVESQASRSERMNVLNSISSNDVEMTEKDRLVQAMRYKSEGEMLDESRWRLFKFMLYDLLIFVICVGLVLWMIFFNMLSSDATVTNNKGGYGDSNWQFVMGLFWVKCFYGFMSFPFAILKLPLLSTLISHSRPTGYNPYGVTVPYLGVEEDHPVPWDPTRQPRIKEI